MFANYENLIRFMHELSIVKPKFDSMKRSGILFFVMALFLFSCEEEAKEAIEEEPRTQKSRADSDPGKDGGLKAISDDPTTIVFGTRSHPCNDGEGCCGDKGVCLIIKTSVAGDDPELEKGEGLADISMTEDGKILWAIKEDTYEDNKGDEFQVPQDRDLSREVTRALGYDRVTLQEGGYEVDYSHREYPYGVVELEADLD